MLTFVTGPGRLAALAIEVLMNSARLARCSRREMMQSEVANRLSELSSSFEFLFNTGHHNLIAAPDDSTDLATIRFNATWH